MESELLFHLFGIPKFRDLLIEDIERRASIS